MAKSKYENKQEEEDDVLKQYENTINNGEISSDRDTVTIPKEEYNRLKNANVFSTDEIEIGTWMGAKLYQKTIDCGALPKETNKEILHGIQNMDMIADYFGVAKDTNTNMSIKLPHVHDTGNYGIQVNIDNSKIYIYSRNTDRSTYNKSYVTIKYTKTTEAVSNAE